MPPTRPTWLHNLRKSNVVCVLAFSLPMAIRGAKMVLRWPNRASNGAQHGPKTALRAPKRAPRASQEGFKRRSARLPRGGANWGTPFL
eukprot:7653280-Pyramimonas_sp.AAC.1